jgi:hypothetical protein
MSTFADHAAVEPPPSAPRQWWETRTFALLLMLLSIVPLLYPQNAALVDLFGHIGRYRVQLDVGSSAYLQRYYEYDWAPIGNLGVDGLVQLLGPILGLETAVKLIIMSIPVLTVAGFLLVAREVHHRLPPVASPRPAGSVPAARDPVRADLFHRLFRAHLRLGNARPSRFLGGSGSAT